MFWPVALQSWTSSTVGDLSLLFPPPSPSAEKEKHCTVLRTSKVKISLFSNDVKFNKLHSTDYKCISADINWYPHNNMITTT